MSVVIQDECIKYLCLAQECMKDWIPMTEYEVLFEAVEKTQTADKVTQNERTATRSVGFVQKAIDAVIKLIKNLYETIVDFIDKIFMGRDERDAFAKFKESTE